MNVVGLLLLLKAFVLVLGCRADLLPDVGDASTSGLGIL